MIRGALAIMFLFSVVVSAAGPVGVACPVPRARHKPDDDPSTRVAWEAFSRRPADCCGPIINGVRMSADGVICWPVLDGDDITAQTWPVMIVFFDKGRVLLGEGSRVQFDARKSVVQIRSGIVHWALPADSHRQMSDGDRAIPARLGMASRHGGKLDVIAESPFPDSAPDPVELLRRFPYVVGPLRPSDVP